MTGRTFGVWAVLLAGAVVARPGRAQDGGAQEAARAAAAGVMDSVVTDSLALVLPTGYRFAPVFANKIDGNVSSVGMSNEFRTSIMTPFGPLFNFSLKVDEKDYRLQNRLEDNKQLAVSSLYTLSPGFNAALSYTDNRVFNRSIAPGGGIQDFIFNDQTVSGNASYNKKVDATRVDWAASAQAVDRVRTYKSDQTLAAGANGGIGYNLPGDRVVVQARGMLRGSSDRSEANDSLYTGLGSREDSLAAVVRVALADSMEFRVDYSRYHGRREYLDQAVGALGGQLSGAQNVVPEGETRDSEGTILALRSLLFEKLDINVKAAHDEQLFDYDLQTTRFSRTVSDAVNGTIRYTTPWATTAVILFENRKSLRDFGPQSIASTRDEKQRLSVALSHKLRETLTVTLNASQQLQQSFYLDYEANPRDRDQLDSAVNFVMNSAPFSKVTATVTLGYTASEFVNIDQTQSINNRRRDLYELRPGFTYTMNDRVSITQTYGLAIEYTDFTYTQEDNFLDRNITLVNVFNLRPTRRVRFRLQYDLVVHDTGSYLPTGPGGQEVLDVSGEDRRDRMLLRVDYDVNQHIGVFAEQGYNHFSDRDVTTDFERVTTDGTLQVGTRGNYDWGGGRKLTFLFSKVRRFSPFGSEAEKDYWDMRSEFNYPF